MIIKALENKKIASIFVEEGRFISGLFGGFSLALLAVPIGKYPSVLEMASIFISSFSSMLLVLLAYVLTMVSGLDRAKKHDRDFHLIEFEDIDQNVLSSVGALVVVSVLIFLLNIVLVCFRVHWIAGLGSLIAFTMPFFVEKYLDRKPR